MPEIKLPESYRVDIIESERGWGQKTVDKKFFDNAAEAKQWAEDYNKKNNTSATVPDWYMYAAYVGKVS